MLGFSKVDKIKRHYNILDFIRSKGVELKKSGSGYVGLCPFHDDTNPSLRVTPEKGLFNCPACNVGGDTITFHEKWEKISNKQAIKDLYSGIEEPGTIKNPQIQSVSEATLLQDVCKLYHSNLEKSKVAQEYLISRGLTNKEVWKRFQIGYSDGGTLKKAIPSSGEIPYQLEELGLLNIKGNESFYKCITIPVQEKDGIVTELYGRSIEGNRQMYLKGEHRGILNGQVALNSDIIIIAESVIDALSLIQIGYTNVIPLYGTNGFTSDHRIYLRENGFDEIILCLDNDNSGKKAIDKIAKELSSLTAKISYILLPQGIKDPNEFICNGGEKADFEALLQARKVLSDPQSKENKAQDLREGLIEYDGDQALFRSGEGLYRARGVKSELSDTMRVLLRLEVNGQQHIDRLDLYSDRARKGFANTAAHKCLMQSARIDADLISIVEAVEKMQLKEKKQADSSEGSKEMPGPERNEAITFLKQKKLLKRIIKDIDTLGYIQGKRAIMPQ